MPEMWVIGLLGLVAILLVGSRRRSRERLQSIESRVDVLVQQLGLEGATGPPPSAEVRQLAQNGEVIAAIRLHRTQHPGLGLKAAKLQIDELRGGLFGPAPPPDANRIVRKLDRVLESFDLPLVRSVEPAAPAVPDEVAALAGVGRKIEAIKLLRAARPELGLREAKQIVEGLGASR